MLKKISNKQKSHLHLISLKKKKKGRKKTSRKFLPHPANGQKETDGSSRGRSVAQPHRWKCQRAYHSDGCLHKQLSDHKPKFSIFSSLRRLQSRGGREFLNAEHHLATGQVQVQKIN